jgi:hypothetical protein
MLNPEAAQPVNVVIQAPAQHWWANLIPVLIGAALSLLGGAGMEYCRPWISERAKRRKIRETVNREFSSNLSLFQAVCEIVNQSKGYGGILALRVFQGIMAAGINTEMYDHYHSTEKESLYKVDKDRELGGFYRLLRQMNEGLVPSDTLYEKRESFALALSMAEGYRKGQGIDQKPVSEEPGLLFRMLKGERNREVQL